jgi:UDP:flavonoid glycosyltransferase YjiC (YdhE family)
MKLGFICINVPGHLNPMTALARHLQARNHDVRARREADKGQPFAEQASIQQGLYAAKNAYTRSPTLGPAI